jgi:ribosomal protein S18 acetylase RimI-like enzyme
MVNSGWRASTARNQGNEMSMAILRPAKVKDAEGIAYIHVTAWQDTYRGLMPASVLDTLSVERRARQWKETLEDTSNPFHPALVAESNRKIVGFANYGREREGDPEYRGELFAIYILKEYQGEGIGRKLVQKAAEGLLFLDLTSMLVWVLSDNPYQKFYERLGGVYLRDKSLQIGDAVLTEKAYGWKDIRPLAQIIGSS